MLIGWLVGGMRHRDGARDAGRGPRPSILALALLFGATAIGWNGVQLSEVARLAPPGTPAR